MACFFVITCWTSVESLSRYQSLLLKSCFVRMVRFSLDGSCTILNNGSASGSFAWRARTLGAFSAALSFSGEGRDRDTETADEQSASLESSSLERLVSRTFLR